MCYLSLRTTVTLLPGLYKALRERGIKGVRVPPRGWGDIPSIAAHLLLTHLSDRTIISCVRSNTNSHHPRRNQKPREAPRPTGSRAPSLTSRRWKVHTLSTAHPLRRTCRLRGYRKNRVYATGIDLAGASEGPIQPCWNPVRKPDSSGVYYDDSGGLLPALSVVQPLWRTAWPVHISIDPPNPCP